MERQSSIGHDDPLRFFKRTRDGQWQRKSTDGTYLKLRATRLLRKLEAALSKHIRRKE